MPEITEAMKLRLHVTEGQDAAFRELTKRYAQACDFVSRYVFDNGFILNPSELQKRLYTEVRARFGLKSQLAVSVFKTVAARYKTVEEQMSQRPYKYRETEGGPWKYVRRTLEWLTKPIRFRRPQADLVRWRDYSFTKGGSILSLNTLGDRAKVTFDMPPYFSGKFLDGSWRYGAGKLMRLNGEWYFHISMSRKAEEADPSCPQHVVGIDRGLRFLAVTYDEKGHTAFYSGKDAMSRRQSFSDVRAGLQSRGTRSAKRVLKRISGREKRWMSDVNHQISKALVSGYGKGTLFVLEDLTGVSFDEGNLSRGADGNRELRSWAFYQFGQYLEYKAREAGASVQKVAADYTSQRCPKCGRIHKENRHRETHEYVCDACGYRSNNDRVGAMNIQTLGTMYVSGDASPRFRARKAK